MRVTGILILCIAIVFSGCRKDNLETDSDVETIDTETHYDPSDYIWDESEIVYITLNQNSITVDGEGAVVSGSVLTIVSAGTYQLSGKLTDGQIIVDSDDEEIIRLIFDGIDVFCSSDPPVIVKSSEKTMIVLAESTVNFISDNGTYANADEYNAAFYSADDLTFYGEGQLTVEAGYNDGITSKDGLIISSGNLVVTAVDDAIRGKDYLIVSDGQINTNSGGDGYKSSNDENEELGYISIQGGTHNIVSGSDAIQAETDISITGGELILTTGGGSSQSSGSDGSSKGIKTSADILIETCEITIDVADDGIHADMGIVINSGDVIISSADDAFKSDASITINDGTVSINKSSEGMEAPSITINGGHISVIAEDDGINPTFGVDGEQNDGSKLQINDGYVFVKTSEGDAIDSNGDIDITGGVLVVHGSPSQGGFDVNGSAIISGGYAIISGTNNHMTEGFSASSDQNSIMIRTNTNLEANSIIHLEDESGNEIFSFSPYNSYKSIVFSSSLLVNGTSYKLYTSGDYISGTEKHGLFSGGSYEPGDLEVSFTLSSSYTEIEF